MSSEAPRGLLVIDKPAGLTSHDVVERVRRILNARAGHAGTLDPQATGVLLVCVGPATRLSRFLQGHDKIYDGTVKLGWATDTYDAEGQPLAEPVTPGPLERATVEGVLETFVGVIKQAPPAYSAKKVRGQPAYRRARRGEAVQPEPVDVVIYSAELTDCQGGELRLRVHCGAGTYMRTLAHDLGAALGCPAHLARLRRLRSGPFDLAGAVSGSRLDDVSAAELADHLLAPVDMLPGWPVAVVDAEGEKAAQHGGMIEAGRIVERRPAAAPVHGAADGENWVRVVDRQGRLRAAGEMVPGGLVQPRVVLA